MNQKQTVKPASKATVEATVAETKPKETVAPEAQPNTEPSVNVVEPTAPAPAASTPAPQTYAFAAEMNAAGIPAPNHGQATEMLLDASGWRTQGHQWQKAQSQASNDLVSALAYANSYVVRNYGDWPTAYSLWINAGNF